MTIRAYLVASMFECDSNSAKERLVSFAQNKNVGIASFYVETQSGVKFNRSELHRLIKDSQPGDVLLIEKFERLSRVSFKQWAILKKDLINAEIYIVVLDQPLTHQVLVSKDRETSMQSRVLTKFMLDLAVTTAKDVYKTHLMQQKQGIKKAQAEGRYKGRLPDEKLRSNIRYLLDEGHSWSQIQKKLGCSRSTIAKTKKATTY